MQDDSQLTISTRKQGRSFESGPVLFSVMRNETYFLPFFLKHYRGLGVRQFCIYADRCNSRTLAILEAQSDVTILESKYSFGDVVGKKQDGTPKRFVHYLKEVASEQMFLDRWVLTVDADEFLILPPPAKTLDDFLGTLERADQAYCFASMVDFYPQTLEKRNYAPDIDPFHVSCFFDMGPYHEIDIARGRLQTFSHGVRERILLFLRKNYPREVEAIYGKHPVAPARNHKIPLLRHGRGIVRNADHKINELPTLDFSVALAHFKFYPELDMKIKSALAEGQYYNGSMEYRFLKLALDKLSKVDLVREGSKRFTGPESLVEARLLARIDQRMLE